MKRRIIAVFDLDDTLYKEVEFVKSAFRFISQHLFEANQAVEQENVYNILWHSFLQKEKDTFGMLIRRCKLNQCTKTELLDWYRYHKPTIQLEADVKEALDLLKGQVVIGIITDGRKETQMNKIEALGLNEYIEKDDIVINETVDTFKPDKRSFLKFVKKYGRGNYYYVGDNTEKDFVAANALGWTTICLLDDGRNIHKQDLHLSSLNLPQFSIGNMRKLISHLSLADV